MTTGIYINSKLCLFINSVHLSKTYIDDATGDRVWVDLKDCKKLADNILTIFNTRTIGGGTEEGGQQDEGEGTMDELSGLVGNIPVQPR